MHYTHEINKNEQKTIQNKGKRDKKVIERET